MERNRFLATLVILLFALSAVPPSTAEDPTKTELENPDETYFGFESGWAMEDKEVEPLKSTSNETVNVTLKKKGSSSSESSTVTFPYEKFQWTISKCYRSDYGLRFYGVYYDEEKILYDYRVPWVKIDGVRYDLTIAKSTDAPTLYIWNSQEVFKVEVSYSIDEADAEVDVYCYFYADGSFDPWVQVDCNRKRNVEVGQRFDFDLGGASDDNADFFLPNSTWDLVRYEDDHPDEGNPEDGGVQWVLFDTDVEGTGSIVDQKVDLIPYHLDDSDLHILRYHSGEIGGDPFAYDNDETTGLYSGSTYDHYIGEDLVAWYVSDYTHVRWCNPGPWTEVEV
ncbi:MAG: hypothetical protein KAJ35_01225 [Thermoplasmata archaeon]|nr:hypothetical protein [Thermoplasmata archaeon]